LTVRLLLTRPEADAQRTAAALRARGHNAVIAPLLRIEAVADAKIGPGPWQAILVTSTNAALSLTTQPAVAGLRELPVFAVGQSSARAMADAGFTDVSSADGNVSDLARLIVARLKPGMPLLYLAGADQSGDLAGELRSHDFAVETVVVYRAVAAATLPPAAADALAGGIDGVLHYSRRSAEAYIDAARAAGSLAAALQPIHYCISARAAEPLGDIGAAVRIALKPTEASLFALIGPV
jgi:uroporphyrinogen-III synthase